MTVAGTHIINAGLTLNSSAAINVAGPSDSLTVNGRIADGGTGKGLTLSGCGMLVLANTNNAYSGGTTLNGGILRFAALGSLGSGNITFGGGTLQYPPGGGISSIDVSSQFAAVPTGQQAIIDTNGNTVTFQTPISGAGGLGKVGNGMLVLTGNHLYTGPTTVSGGTLQLGNGVVDGTIQDSSNVTNNSVLRFNTVGAQTYGGAISGSGSVVKTGAGTQTLTGLNTYSGVTIITAGTLKLGAVPTPTTVGLNAWFDASSLAMPMDRA